MRVSLAVLILACNAATAAADDGGITVTTSFVMGSLEVGHTHGMLAPAGHLDLGFRVRRWRLAAEAQSGLWSEPHEPDVPYTSGRLTRVGMALQWTWKDLALPRRTGKPDATFRGFVEVGLGRQHVETELGEVSRNDVMLGLGMSPELKFGNILFGATFGVRLVVARAPTTTIARGESTMTSQPALDTALLYVFGVRFGR